MTAAFDRGVSPPGRTHITKRALTSLVTGVAAESIGVDVADVGVAFRDDHRLLAITVTTIMPSASLDGIRHDPTLVGRAGGTLLDRAARAEKDIATRVAYLTGLSIGHVTMSVTGVRPPVRSVR